MSKKLVPQYSENCIGCELCVLECQRQLKKVGLEQSMIRILKNKKVGSEYPSYSVDIDPRVQDLDVKKIKDICPTEVFDLVDSSENEHSF